MNRFVPLLIVFALNLMVFGLKSCDSEENDEKIGENTSETEEIEPLATYVVAGHTYGHAERFTQTIHPPFISAFKKLQQKRKVDGLFLTGDVVAHPRPTQWDSTKQQLEELDVPWYVAVGNHDATAHFYAEIQTWKHKAVRENGSLFIVLHTSRPGWTVDTSQIATIEKELQSLEDVNSVYVFTHQLWWQRPGAPEHIVIDSVHTNSFAMFEGESSFWEDAWPLFDSVPDKDIYFFAGDLGCHEIIQGYTEDHFGNYHFYGSGMGGGLEDNFMLIDFYENDSVNIQRIDF